MTFNYNVTGTERKRLADYISGFMGTEKKYLGAPTFAYQIGYITVSKDGAVSFEDRGYNSDIDALMSELEAEGFHTEDTIAKADSDEAATEPDKARGGTKDAGQPEGEDTPSEMPTADGLTIHMPAASFTPEAFDNLRNLVAAKGRLISKALGAANLPVEVSADKVSFPWFNGKATAEEVKAYTHLVAALCDMARNQKRITAKEKITDNDKYAFRCFLLRLGFIGAEFKDERKILLRNLSGNSAFKSGAKHTAETMADSMLIEQVNASFGGENDAVSA